MKPRPARISPISSTSSCGRRLGVGPGWLPRACPPAAPRGRRGRRGRADRPARAVGRGEVVGEVGVRRDHGVAPGGPGCAVLHRGSSSTYSRRAYLPSRAWSTGSIRCGRRRPSRPVPPSSSTQTLPPLTSSTTTPTSGISTTRSSSWSLRSSVSRTLARSTSSAPTVARSRSDSRSDWRSRRGVSSATLTCPRAHRLRNTRTGSLVQRVSEMTQASLRGGRGAT